MTLSVGSGPSGAVAFLVRVLICMFRFITARERAFRLRSLLEELR